MKRIIIILIILLLVSGCAQQEKEIEAEKNLKVHFIANSFGESILIQTPTGENILVDGGSYYDALDYLKSKGVTTVDVAIASHQHYDHILGLYRVIEDPDVEVRQFYHNNDTRLVYHTQIWDLVQENPALKSGDRLEFGEVAIDVLWPPSNNPELLEENTINDNSMVLRLSYYNISLLLTGDCLSWCEGELIQRHNLESDILKAGHHGLPGSSTPQFLEEVKPEIIVVTSHSRKDWGYVGNEWIDDFEAEKINTRDVGNIIITTDGTTYGFETEKAQFRVYDAEALHSDLEFISFNYTRDGKSYSAQITNARLLPAMNWIKENTPEKAVFLTWWDNGHMIRGIGERDSIVFAPSREILFTVSKYVGMSEEERAKIECPDCNPHDKIMDVVNALLGDEPSEIRNIMDKYNSDYVLVAERDESASYALFLITGVDPFNYLNEDYSLKESAQDIILFRMINNEDIEGFEKAYSDGAVRIYKKI